MVPPSLSVAPSRSRRLAPITESPPDTPGGPNAAPRRLSLRSLHKTLQRRSRTMSATSSTSTGSAGIRPRSPPATKTDDAAEPPCASPRNSGTFGPIGVTLADDEPTPMQLSPTRGDGGGPALSPASVESPVDGFFAVDDAPSRLSGTFGPSLASVQPLPPPLADPVVEDSRTSTGAQNSFGLGPPAIVPPKLKSPPSATSLFYTPEGSTVSLRLPGDSDALIESSKLDRLTVSAEGDKGQRLSPGQAMRDSTSDEDAREARYVGAHSAPRFLRTRLSPDGSALRSDRDRRASLGLLATRTALVALAQKLSEGAATLEQTTVRLDSVRRSLDIEIEGLIGLVPLYGLDEVPSARLGTGGAPRCARHSAGPVPVGHSPGARLPTPERGSPPGGVVTTASGASSLQPPSWSTISPARSSTPGLVNEQLPMPAWLGKSAQGTIFSSQASLPVEPAAQVAEPRLARRERRQSWIRRLFA
jgi:hypothetical protein